MGKSFSWEIEPTRGVGPIRLGMQRKDILKLLGPSSTSYSYNNGTRFEPYWGRGVGFQYKSPSKCICIELDAKSNATLLSRPIFEQDLYEVLSWLKTLDPQLILTKKAVISPKLGVALTDVYPLSDNLEGQPIMNRRYRE